MNTPGLFTQCTHCKAYFRVWAVTLRVGQGVAFCTSCRNQFNALEQLQEGDPGFPILDAIPVTEPAAPRPEPSREAPPATAEPVARPPEATGVGSQAQESPDTGDEWRWDLEVSEGKVLPRLSEPAVFGESGPESEPEPGPDETGPILSRIPVLEADDEFPAAAQPADAADIRDRITHKGSAAPFAPGDAVSPVASPDIGDLAVVPDAESEPVPGIAAEHPAGRSPPADLPTALWEDLVAPRPRPRPLATAAWSVGILLLLAALAGQFVYFQSANLAHYPALHPWLERFCGLTGCRVPLPRDLADLDLLDRRVYSDPSAPRALVISLILQNNAAFRQAYPYLQVRFFNLAGHVIALRRFAPREYLPQGPDPAAGVQAHGSVPVTLQIVDPGKDAVSYDFEFR
ncbi:MAG TPA: DUF3426 domain-containing protein [Chromatiales bacterium]|nr:DUF3426 domain-containing protein [Chromatiales bacterium]